jgi:choline dehydrogenase
VRCVFESRLPITFNDHLRTLSGRLRMGIEYVLRRRGPLTVAAGYAGGFFHSARAAPGRPDTQIHFITFSTARMGEKLDAFSGFTVSACQLRPMSRGSVHAVSLDSTRPPRIICNYLGHADDRAATVSGLELVRSIMSQSAMRPLTKCERAPGSGCASAAHLLAYARRTGSSLYHPSCTAAMGKATDSALRVIGVDALRVVDASVMPALISGNCNAAVIAIAERGADLILADH